MYVQPYSVFLSGLARLADVCCMAASTACCWCMLLLLTIAHVQTCSSRQPTQQQRAALPEERGAAGAAVPTLTTRSCTDQRCGEYCHRGAQFGRWRSGHDAKTSVSSDGPAATCRTPQGSRPREHNT